MLVSLLRYIQGYLQICVTGYSPERFLNLCKNKKIAIWGLESTSQGYLMYIKISGFRRLKPIIKKTKTKVVIKERVGLPFFFYRYRKRNLFFAGTILCFIFIYSMTFFVWNIDFQGNVHITDSVLMEYLSNKNVTYGMLKNNVNCEQLVKDLRKDFEDIIWVSASMDGTKLMIHIKENTDTFELSEQNTNARDIVSNYAGIVKQIITRSGVPLVKVGDMVEVGDVLISGKVDILNDAKEIVSQKLVLADGDIVLESYIPYEKEITKYYNKKEYTKKKKRVFYMKIGNYICSLGGTKNKFKYYEKRTSETQLQLSNNFFLPIIFGKEEYIEYTTKKTEYTKEEMEKLLKDDFQYFCKKIKANDGKILEKNLVITHGKSKVTASSLMVVEQEVGIGWKIVDF